MLIVIPGALPALPVAAELARCRAPRVARLAAGRRARANPTTCARTAAPPSKPGSRRAGHRPEAGCPWAPAWALLMQDQPQDGEPVWLAELAHLALGADQAMLADPDQMDLRAEESAALYDTVRPLFDGTGFAAEPLDARRWRLRLPEGLAGHRQPAGRRRLNDWWKQDAETRPWRRLLNEIQMAWHDHPVNEARARGVAPVNALWLCGARPGASRRPDRR